ncbi:DUF4097 family beta strand repeat-containing protein [Actinocrispum sp. NPDC049592]|uniref:DUF4097 family beta strand repeat-containing protein n=1 Tax=Actinocrispum sp. NPDC049592 TaxID=3154835 RepID=UPI00343C79CA
MSRRRVVVLGICAAGTLLLAGCNGFRAASSTFDEDVPVGQPVSTVRIESGSGDVRIHTGSKANIHRKVYYQGDKPGATTRFEGNTLVLAECGQRNCSIDYELTLPVAAKVIGEAGSGNIEVVGMSEVGVRAGSGDVTVRNVAGPVTVNTGSGNAELSGLGQSAVVEVSSGDVRLTDVKGDATIQAHSGKVTGTNLGGKTSVDSSSGDVVLSMSAVRNVKATASSGNIKVQVPRGENYHVSAVTDSGDESVNILNDPAGPNLLDLHASSGDITVDYR